MIHELTEPAPLTPSAETSRSHWVPTSSVAPAEALRVLPSSPQPPTIMAQSTHPASAGTRRRRNGKRVTHHMLAVDADPISLLGAVSPPEPPAARYGLRSSGSHGHGPDPL